MLMLMHVVWAGLLCFALSFRTSLCLRGAEERFCSRQNKKCLCALCFPTARGTCTQSPKTLRFSKVMQSKGRKMCLNSCSSFCAAGQALCLSFLLSRSTCHCLKLLGSAAGCRPCCSSRRDFLQHPLLLFSSSQPLGPKLIDLRALPSHIHYHVNGFSGSVASSRQEGYSMKFLQLR